MLSEAIIKTFITEEKSKFRYRTYRGKFVREGNDEFIDLSDKTIVSLIVNINNSLELQYDPRAIPISDGGKFMKQYKHEGFTKWLRDYELDDITCSLLQK